MKCPSSIKRENLSHENLSFLTLRENDKVTLKQNHSFWYQLQVQKGVTGKNHCDFFIYIHFGAHQERITLNPEIWKNFLQTLQVLHLYSYNLQPCHRYVISYREYCTNWSKQNKCLMYVEYS